MVQITMSKRFAQRFAKSEMKFDEDSIPFSKRVQLVEPASSIPFPSPRASTNTPFSQALDDVVFRHFNGMLIPITQSTAMAPWINPGQRAVMIPFQSFHPFRHDDLKVGDIVLAAPHRGKTKNELHRVQEIKSGNRLVLSSNSGTLHLNEHEIKDDITHVCIGVSY